VVYLGMNRRIWNRVNKLWGCGLDPSGPESVQWRAVLVLAMNLCNRDVWQSLPAEVSINVTNSTLQQQSISSSSWTQMSTAVAFKQPLQVKATVSSNVNNTQAQLRILLRLSSSTELLTRRTAEALHSLRANVLPGCRIAVLSHYPSIVLPLSH
jgi:hypothetical protein